MVLDQITCVATNDEPLRASERPVPVPGDKEILIAVSVCGVCHTELDEIEGRTEPPSLPVIPGHEVVGRVAGSGKLASRFSPGDRVGVGWINSSDGGEHENLSASFKATGRDVDGGYAEYMVVNEDYACLIPDVFTDEEAAPLLCAGAVGYRALKLCELQDGDALGLMGFGGSAHLVFQSARYLFPDSPIYAFARDAESRDFSMELGADWAGDIDSDPPGPLNAIIDTTPAWKPVVASLAQLTAGGRLVINAIRKEDSDKSELQKLSYHDHLWMEKELKSVANVAHKDIEEFLELAARIPIRPKVTVYPFADANEALVSLKRDSVQGAKVLRIAAVARQID